MSHVLGQTNASGLEIIRFQTRLSHIHLQHSATCLGTNQCCWVRNHTPVLHECSPVRSCKGAAYDLAADENLLLSYTCNLYMAVPGCLHPKSSWTRERKDFSLHNLNNLGDSVTCLLQDCLNMPRLPEYSSLIVSPVNGKVTGDITSIFCHLLPQCHMSWDRPMLLGCAIQKTRGQERGRTSHFTI